MAEKIRVVSSAKFDRIVSKNIQLNRCRCCGGDGEIVVALPTFGPRCVVIRCNKCDASIKNYRITQNVVDECGEKTRIGTPITPKSLQYGILNAVNMWNIQNPKESDGECVNVSISGVLSGD